MYILQHFKLLIKLSITIHQKIVIFPKIITAPILFIGTIQTLLFILRPTIHEYNIYNTHADLIQYMMYISRFDLLIYDKFQFISIDRYFVIPLGFVLLDALLLNTLAFYLNNSAHKSLKLQLEEFSFPIQSLIFIDSCYSQLIIVYLQLPFYALCFIQLQQSYDDGVQFSMCVLTIIFLAISDRFRYLTCHESNSLMINGFDKLEVPYTDQLKYVIMIFQLIIFLILDPSVDATTIQAIAVILSSGIGLATDLFLENMPIKSNLYASMSANSLSLVYTFCFISEKQNYFVFLSPIMIYICISKIRQKEQNSILQIKSLMENKHLKLFYSRLLNKEFKSTSSIQKIQQVLILKMHSRKCDDVNCYCRYEHEQDDLTTIQFLTDTQYFKFLLKKISQFNKAMDPKVQMSNTDCLHYASTLSLLGLRVQAYQQCMLFYLGGISPITHRQYSRGQTLYQLDSSKSRSSKSRTNQLSEEDKLQSHAEKEKRKSEKTIMSNIKIQVSWFTKIRFEMLILEIKQNLYTFLDLNSGFSKEFNSRMIQTFIQNENRNQLLHGQLLSLIMNKAQFYQFLKDQQQLRIDQIFKKIYALGLESYTLQRQIQLAYEKFPSSKLQSIMCFLHAEIMNDYLEATKMQSLTSISETKLLDQKLGIVLQKDQEHITVSLNNQQYELAIQKASSNLGEYLGYDKQKFNDQLTLDFLFPRAIARYHHMFIQRFIQTGTNRYFRNWDLMFVQQESLFIKPYRMLIDINYQSVNSLCFTAFLQDIQTDTAFILVDIDGHVGGISQNFFLKAGYSEQSLKQFSEVIISAHSVEITTLMPEFGTQAMYQKINILKPEIFQQSNIKLHNTWLGADNYRIFIGSIQVIVRNLYNYLYYIIQIEDIKPNDDLPINNEEDFLNIGEITISEEQAPNQPKGLEEVSEQPVVNIDARQEIYMMSPNVSISRVIDSSKYRIQQQFFNNEDGYVHELMQNQAQAQQIEEDNESNSVKNNKPADSQRFNHNGHLVEDQQSKTTSGVPKSAYYKKYDLIQKITQNQAITQTLLISYSLIGLFIITSIIYFIIILSQTRYDLTRFESETQLLYMHAAFMSPMDNYQAMRTQILQYQTMYRSNLFDNQTIYTTYTNWLTVRLADGFQDMHSNFVQQFSNPYTAQFFIGNFISVKFSYLNTTFLMVKNISFSESLNLLLEYQFVFKAQYGSLSRNNSNSNGTYYGNGGNNNAYTIYVIANYDAFHKQFTKLTNTILDYSIQRTKDVSFRWLLTWIIFLSILTILIIGSYWQYQKHIIFYTRYLILYQNLEQSIIQRNIDNYKQMIKGLKQDQNIIFQYYFNLESKEKQFSAKIVSKEQKQKINERHQQNKLANSNIGVIYRLLVFLLQISIFFCFTIVIQVQVNSYTSKYATTASLYSALSDLTYILPGIYFQRSLLNNQTKYKYYTTDDWNNIYSRVAFGLQSINKFQNFLITYDSDAYLINSDFDTLMRTSTQGPICPLLSSDIQAQVANYCSVALSGSLMQGYGPSLSYVYHSLQNEQAINNFTDQTVYNLFEVEGAYILMRATQNIINQLHSAIFSKTDNLTEQITAISVSYILVFIFVIAISFGIVINYHRKEQLLVKRSILLIPPESIFMNDTFERQLKFIQIQEQNI